MLAAIGSPSLSHGYDARIQFLTPGWKVILDTLFCLAEAMAPIALMPLFVV